MKHASAVDGWRKGNKGNMTTADKTEALENLQTKVCLHL